jgi:hypothetical protein
MHPVDADQQNMTNLVVVVIGVHPIRESERAEAKERKK